jgi:undecaprenyl diphosphate synthase
MKMNSDPAVEFSTKLPRLKRLPEHIGIIPDGNRRWAVGRTMPKSAGYDYGLKAGFRVYELCVALGIKELTLYGFTQDNTKRPADQTDAFQNACVNAVKWLVQRDAALLVIGDSHSPLFPAELLPLTKRTVFGRGSIRVNLLVNYSWRWDINHSSETGSGLRRSEVEKGLASADVSRIDLIVRWGGRQRLSGFLPVQSVYADFYFLDALWPDFEPEHLFHALRWYELQDVTLGG